MILDWFQLYKRFLFVIFTLPKQRHLRVITFKNYHYSVSLFLKKKKKTTTNVALEHKQRSISKSMKDISML